MTVRQAAGEAGRLAGDGAGAVHHAGGLRVDAGSATAPAVLDHVGMIGWVTASVLGQMVAPGELLGAEGAGEALLARVRPVVAGQLVGARELLVAVEPVAGERALSRVGALVGLQMRRLVIGFVAARKGAAVALGSRADNRDGKKLSLEVPESEPRISFREKVGHQHQLPQLGLRSLLRQRKRTAGSSLGWLEMHFVATAGPMTEPTGIIGHALSDIPALKLKHSSGPQGSQKQVRTSKDGENKNHSSRCGLSQESEGDSLMVNAEQRKLKPKPPEKPAREKQASLNGKSREEERPLNRTLRCSCSRAGFLIHTRMDSVGSRGWTALTAAHAVNGSLTGGRHLLCEATGSQSPVLTRQSIQAFTTKKTIRISHLKRTSHPHIHIRAPYTTIRFGSLSRIGYSRFSARYLTPAFQNTRQESKGGYAVLRLSLPLPDVHRETVTATDSLTWVKKYLLTWLSLSVTFNDQEGRSSMNTGWLLFLCVLQSPTINLIVLYF
ncbi:hypothetical protein PANDA_001313 [Ailuropoda melanoleuca]|uniref:Uncharacterized protein n=1 Tax=Ailuropoda melanoleuca TaxID=9646 RepID=D2GWU4_AILME|nr:hypothetical protein PANDA_001313 [Ailuropoda melanoleuca]